MEVTGELRALSDLPPWKYVCPTEVKVSPKPGLDALANRGHQTWIGDFIGSWMDGRKVDGK